MPATEDTRERWFEIALEVPAADVDAATGLLAAVGFTGSEIDERDVSATMRIHVACDGAEHARTRADGAVALLAHLGARLVSIKELDESVWREGWKRHFERTAIGKRLEIRPPWCEAAASGERIAIVINPGLAFGTGQHETTAGCLELLEKAVVRGTSVLDVGCGSGILAIAAAKLGATRIVAVDNDPEALNAVRENTVLNRVERFVDARLAEGPPAGETFDVVVANILAETLAEMAIALTSCVKRGGTLVLSGIESTRSRLVQDAFRAQGWRQAEMIERSGWVSLALARDVGEEAWGG